MMAAHTARLAPRDVRPAWGHAVLLYEPLIPSLFLLLVGWSLARSLGTARIRGGEGVEGSWYARQARRALMLWAVSALFYTLELGFRLPDALTASGILANIAYAILIVGGLLMVPRASMALGAALIAGIAMFVGFDAAGTKIFAVNTGNAPFLPLWLFAIAGALWGIVAGNRSAWKWIAATTGAVIATLLVARYGGESLFTKPLGRSDAGRWVVAPLFGAGEARHLAYYNLRPLLALACAGAQIAAFAVLSRFLREFPAPAARRLFALGRYALSAYILHLTLLALMVVLFGRQPFYSSAVATAALLGIVAISQLFVVFRSRQ